MFSSNYSKKALTAGGGLKLIPTSKLSGGNTHANFGTPLGYFTLSPKLANSETETPKSRHRYHAKMTQVVANAELKLKVITTLAMTTRQHETASTHNTTHIHATFSRRPLSAYPFPLSKIRE